MVALQRARGYQVHHSQNGNLARNVVIQVRDHMLAVYLCLPHRSEASCSSNAQFAFHDIILLPLYLTLLYF